MKSKIMALALVIAMLVLVTIVSGAGCGKADAETEVQNLDSEFGDLESLNEEINSLNIDELNETELEGLDELL
ncbi:MAG: hypothetical protein QW622_03200 [Candidatus Pacearchaeota archaeon]